MASRYWGVGALAHAHSGAHTRDLGAEGRQPYFLWVQTSPAGWMGPLQPNQGQGVPAVHDLLY